MALLRWLQPRNGLPDPRGSLSSSIPSQAIAAANREVEEAIRTASSGKRAPIDDIVRMYYIIYGAPYGQYSPTVRAEISKYACHRGVATKHQSLPYFSMFAPRVKFSRKAHSAKILLCEFFSREPFITRKFPDVRYMYTCHIYFCMQRLAQGLPACTLGALLRYTQPKECT